METARNVLSLLGLMVCSYTAAHLLSPFINKYSSRSPVPFFLYPLMCIWYLLYACSAFVGLLDHFLWSKLHVQSALLEERKKNDALIAIKDREISALKERLQLYESPRE